MSARTRDFAPGLGPVSLKLARTLADPPGMFVTVRALLAAAYGKDDRRWPKQAKCTLRVLVHRMRGQFPGSIGSRHGVGYMLVPDSPLHRLVQQTKED